MVTMVGGARQKGKKVAKGNEQLSLHKAKNPYRPPINHDKMKKELSKIELEIGPNHQESIGGNVSSVIEKGLPPKLKDLGSFTVDIFIGGTLKEKAMLDLGPGINLMSYSIYKRLGLSNMKHTSMSLVLADQSS